MSDSAQIWSPRDPVPTLSNYSSIFRQLYTANGGQTLFNINNFAYVPGTNSILVYLDGILLTPQFDVAETSEISFTLATPTVGGEEVLVIGFIGSIQAVVDPFYLGPKLAAPTEDNQGITLSSIHEGYTYWNSISKNFWIFDGTALTWGLQISSVATSANQVSIADTGGYYTGGDVEAALQELGVLVVVGTPGIANANKIVHLGPNKDLNELALADIISAFGSKILSFLGVASAVNYLEVINSAAGLPVKLSSVGDSAGSDLLIEATGTNAGVDINSTGTKDVKINGEIMKGIPVNFALLKLSSIQQVTTTNFYHPDTINYTPLNVNSTIYVRFYLTYRVKNLDTSGSNNSISASFFALIGGVLSQIIPLYQHTNVDEAQVGPNFYQNHSGEGIVTYANTTGASVNISIRLDGSDALPGDSWQIDFPSNVNGGTIEVFEIAN